MMIIGPYVANRSQQFLLRFHNISHKKPMAYSHFATRSQLGIVTVCNDVIGSSLSIEEGATRPL
jgi:hypothetical protein